MNLGVQPQWIPQYAWRAGLSLYQSRFPFIAAYVEKESGYSDKTTLTRQNISNQAKCGCLTPTKSSDAEETYSCWDWL